ncbi:type VI secretion system lipoprotein TssJ [Bordetella sp. LUAb4]|uniref:type VI secretion system lipoprotein TssJ n=1 Tax=Bordetella sp. LUAb4 TaxID=2843195 RepID=UPI001E55DB86|nr:type VI secretion system lipoprotein TssJ [Bordetella sp. LUAb4]
MRPILTAATLLCVLALSACAGNETSSKEPVRLVMSFNAQSDINPDDRGRPAPIVVRVYELKNAEAFKAADFFTLQKQDRKILADDIVKRTELQLRPGEQRTVVRGSDAATMAIGVVASYRDLPNSVWRAVYRMPAAPEKSWYRSSTPKLKLNIDLAANAVMVKEEQQ